MKWIEIAKAKPKFKTLYLVFSETHAPVVGTLDKSETSSEGVVHTFDTLMGPVQPTHIALITLPTEKEVANG